MLLIFEGPRPLIDKSYYYDFINWKSRKGKSSTNIKDLIFVEHSDTVKHLNTLHTY